MFTRVQVEEVDDLNVINLFYDPDVTDPHEAEEEA